METMMSAFNALSENSQFMSTFNRLLNYKAATNKTPTAPKVPQPKIEPQRKIQAQPPVILPSERHSTISEAQSVEEAKGTDLKYDDPLDSKSKTA